MVRYDLPYVSVDGVSIPYGDSVVYLGVTLTSTFFWDKHVIRIVSRDNSLLHQLKIYKNLFSSRLQARLVSSLLVPYFEYCCTLLTNISGNCNLLLQGSFVRFIFKAKWYITSLLENFKWFRIASFFINCLIYKVLKTRRSQMLYNTSVFRRGDGSRNTRAVHNALILPPVSNRAI